MKSYWIRNRGDWEIFHTNLVNSRREQYGMDCPPFRRIYDIDRDVVFFSQRATPDGLLRLRLNGKGYIKIDGQMHPDGETLIRENKKYKLSAGKQIEILKGECLNA